MLSLTQGFDMRLSQGMEPSKDVSDAIKKVETNEV